MGFAQKTARLAVWQVTTAAAHEFWKNNERGQVSFFAKEMAHDGTHVRGLHATSESAPGLHHLPAGIVHGGAIVVTGTHQ
jgi:hypothetical protein